MKAVSLFSGGLDSQLAICVIQEQGIEVEAVNFKSPFFGGGQTLIDAAGELGVSLKTIDISDEYMQLLKDPRYGFGKNMNPCIDCHGFMIRKVGEYMREISAQFIITGEVLGQRPMSQNRSAMDAVEKISGFRGLVVRPLSAKLLSPTIPETEGWIDRSQLLDIQGRSRARQMELAEKYEITDYPSPAGGCLLTIENFSNRLRQLLSLNPDPKPRHTEILKFGRHFMCDDRALLAIGRKHTENEALIGLADEDDFLIKVATHPGPTALLRTFKPLDENDIGWAASLTARYSDACEQPLVKVKIWHPGQQETFIECIPVKRTDTPSPI